MDNLQPNQEGFDSLDKLSLVVKRNLKSIIKSAPAIIGFSLFLIYFCENHFFPSFDIFSLGSLLIAASILGLLVFATLTFGISMPGLMWTDIFLKDKEVSNEFKYYLPKDNKRKLSQAQLRIIRVYFFLPATLCAYINIYAITSNSDYALYSFAAPVAVCLALATCLKLEYRLSAPSLLKFVLASLISYSLASIISLLFVVISLKGHFPDAPEHLQIILALIVTLAMNVTFTVCAISFQNLKYSHTIFFSMLFAFFLSFISNMWFTLPGGIAKTLGIGNYTATEIHVSGDPCKIKSIPWENNNDQSCTLINAKVVWSLGDTHRIKAYNKDISLPTKNIISVIKEGQQKNPG
ncbi:hypothetical protein ACSVIJ_07565 [Pseudomonas sp. NCHU5208]|uniref:hypothetical protein n=1 Tax=unclassified Pseudomonas TaxID=196821 RepID=UPI003F9D0F0C